uniref:Peptidase S1 domain-containing protein n=1 Tax=Hyaloperonospora arabidopsidis (strain Emoy2) TaxID=559515 RepID=M4BNK7_HYAAE
MKFTVAVRVSVLASVLVATYARGTALDKTGALLLDDSTDDEQESTGLTVSEETRIFGGDEADATQFPFIVSLRKSKADANTYCGGTLVASQYVLTAGHCVKTDEATIYASIGSAFAKGAEEGQQIKVIEGYRHPLYNKSGHLYDVGVLKLEKKVSIATIGLGAADGSDNKVGTAATVRGWGITENGSQSSKLEEVDVRIISNDECSKQYKDRITESMLCAGSGQGEDSCNGDSGVRCQLWRLHARVVRARLYQRHCAWWQRCPVFFSTSRSEPESVNRSEEISTYGVYYCENSKSVTD